MFLQIVLAISHEFRTTKAISTVPVDLLHYCEDSWDCVFSWKIWLSLERLQTFWRSEFQTSSCRWKWNEMEQEIKLLKSRTLAYHIL